MYPYINIFGITIPAYGLLLVVSSAAAWLLLVVLSKKKKRIDTEDASLAFLIGISGGIIGAVALRPLIKLVEIIIFREKYKMFSAGELLDYMVGEIVFYGGFLGGIIAVVLFCRKFKIEIVPLFDIGVPALSLAHAIGRMGCFLGGCCYGIELPYNHPFAVIYPSVSAAAPPGVPLLAVPVIEAGFLLILFAGLTLIYLKSDKAGLCSLIYLLIYPMGRFILEFFRGDILRGRYGIFTTSQFISAGIFIFGICYFMFGKRKKSILKERSEGSGVI
ncbi:MAG: prolipoprotein diacylglyceryl transferase [Oscillospiraceae bacterium]|nr:prolipoprotein diacylglyceryl transferase [Oscillospiraceae bacterium]